MQRVLSMQVIVVLVRPFPAPPWLASTVMVADWARTVAAVVARATRVDFESIVSVVEVGDVEDLVFCAERLRLRFEMQVRIFLLS